MSKCAFADKNSEVIHSFYLAPPTKRVFWYLCGVALESANGGYGKGMELVGRFYNRGIYVEQDRKQADYWLHKAMESSDPDAVAEARKELEQNG